MAKIVALRNEKGSYNFEICASLQQKIVALRNEKGSYNPQQNLMYDNWDCSTAK